MPRIHCPLPLHTGAQLDLPAAAARHVQVLRMQPGDTVTLFDGGLMGGMTGGEYTATVLRMGRSDVQVEVGVHNPVERESPVEVHLVLSMPANDRMDWLVEKATELGVASIQPLVTERSVLRLAADRAAKKQAHWQSIAVAACEQCGRNRVPQVHEVLTWGKWVAAQGKLDAGPGAPPQADVNAHHLMLSFRDESQPFGTWLGKHNAAGTPPARITTLSGPEGGLSPQEEAQGMQLGFVPVTLGPRVLRAETAPLALLSVMAVV
jgi:16S rRNA (uracil1498-N3)-methyltransferase